MLDGKKERVASEEALRRLSLKGSVAVRESVYRMWPSLTQRSSKYL